MKAFTVAAGALPSLNPVVRLMRAAGRQADAFHVGIDEFSDRLRHYPRPAAPGLVFATAEWLLCLSGSAHEMLIWGDRLLDGAVMGYEE
jgi:hypothetical protein